MESVPHIPARDAHICDVLIAERAPRLTGSVFWPVLRPAFYALLGYHHARTMADAVAPLSGRDTLGHVSDLLHLEVSAPSLDRIPATGRCVVVCNHPTGIADGIAVYDAVNRRRPDAIFFANADALRVAPRLAETVIPVEWVVAKRTREKTRLTLLAAKEAFEAERCIVLFPAGRISRIGPDGALADPVWAATAASLARKYDAPVVPIHVAGPRSHLFHLFHRISNELRDITLFHELLNKAGKAFRLHVGHPVDPATLPADAVEATLALKTFIERDLSRDPDAVLA
tara:strand:- start:2110 stop:2967 length:858 start_codon:yes stop_codon:yes gene_type:complete